MKSLKKKLWIFIHDFVAHPICALCWIFGAYGIGDWLHDKTVHPINYDDEIWTRPDTTHESRKD